MWVATAIAVAVAAGSAAYGAYSSVSAAQDAKDQAKILAAKEKANREQAAFRLQKRRGVVGQDPGLRDTILTGPIGVVGGQEGGGKTLLGT